MSTDTKSEEIQIPKDVSTNFENNVLKVSGPLGNVEKDFAKIPVTISINDQTVVVKSFSKRKRDIAIIGTVRSLVSNMFKGVTDGFIYRLKIVYAHFPVSIKVKEKEVLVENFLGERLPRHAKIIGDCKVKVEGDDIVVSGIDRSHVGQTSANLEQGTRIKRKDQRVFLDGVYIYEK